MDAALELRIAYDNGDIRDIDRAKPFIEKSDLIRCLTKEFIPSPLYAVWRITALSEIPFASSLSYTNRVVEYIENLMVTKNGFTLTGKETDLLPCYNAMILEAFSKLGRTDTVSVKNAVEWIKEYQPFERNIPSRWHGAGIKRYGGCLKETPCFIGLVKSVKALEAYYRITGSKDERILAIVSKGMDYILRHELYKRLSNKEPINRHILDLAFPASYQLNIVELLELANRTGNIHREDCQSAFEYIRSKRTKEGYWKVNYIYKSDGYISFDKRGIKADWLTYLLSGLITANRPIADE